MDNTSIPFKLTRNDVVALFQSFDIRRINELIDNLTKTCDFPNLLQLQRNLQSPFFNSIRNVYEYVYQQNITNFDEEVASPEILASAAAKSTIA
uniref:L27 domain-containing protein n=1 Tax=Meloidogyne javanica TaxID=6303 RepID=A0A915MNX3_MELJA